MVVVGIDPVSQSQSQYTSLLKKAIPRNRQPNIKSDPVPLMHHPESQQKALQ